MSPCVISYMKVNLIISVIGVGQMVEKLEDSGARQDFVNGAIREPVNGRGRFDLLPGYAITKLAQHFENGAAKYADRNWENGIYVMRYLDSCLRHLFKLLSGGQSEDHAAAALWNIACYIQTLHWVETGELPTEIDDRPERMRHKI